MAGALVVPHFLGEHDHPWLRTLLEEHERFIGRPQRELEARLREPLPCENPRVVAAADDEVVVLWRQRGVSPAGDRFDGPVLGLYQVREGKLARAQMFYFDTAAVASFLVKAVKAKGTAAA